MPRTTTRALASLLVLAGASLAQEEGQTIGATTDLDEIISILDSESFYERDAARIALTNHPALSDEKIAALLRDDATAPEAAALLEGILLERLYALPIGAVGVTFDNTSSIEDGIRVGSTNPDFAAVVSGAIKEGDVILGVDGMDFREMGLDLVSAIDRNTATRLIQTRVFSRVPGESVPLTIRRGEERIELDAELDDYEKHNNANIPTSVRENASRLRFARLIGGERPGVVDVDLDASLWPTTAVRTPFRNRRSPVFEIPAPNTASGRTTSNDPYSPYQHARFARENFVNYANTLDRNEREAAANNAQVR
ncbi:MAG: PDZ domain-containing protein, partial [Planctomycetota bacterium]